MLVVSTVLSGALYLAGPQATLSTYFAEFWGKSWLLSGEVAAWHLLRQTCSLEENGYLHCLAQVPGHWVKGVKSIEYFILHIGSCCYLFTAQSRDSFHLTLAILKWRIASGNGWALAGSPGDAKGKGENMRRSTAEEYLCVRFGWHFGRSCESSPDMGVTAVWLSSSQAETPHF